MYFTIFLLVSLTSLLTVVSTPKCKSTKPKTLVPLYAKMKSKVKYSLGRNNTKMQAIAYDSGILTNASFHHDSGERIYPISAKIPPLTLFFLINHTPKHRFKVM